MKFETFAESFYKPRYSISVKDADGDASIGEKSLYKILATRLGESNETC